MKPLPDAIPNGTLILRRYQESLWLQTESSGRQYFVTLSKDGAVDYPIRYSDGRVGYDFPERLSIGFRRMVRLHLNKAAQAVS